MADVVFVGGAPAVKQITTLTVAGTPGSTETLTVTCNSKSMVVTLPAGQTTSQVAAEIAASLMANSQTDPAPATGYTRSVGGREIIEFRDFTAEASGSTVILTSSVAGTPFTVTLAESMASGTFTQTATQAATGPNHFDNAANYRDGALPVDGDVIGADGDVDILHGLSFLLSGTIACTIDIDISKYTGQIGLPEKNDAGYDEYRTRSLVHYCIDGSKSVTLNSEGGQITSTKPIFIKAPTSGNSLKIFGSRGSSVAPNIVIDGTATNEYDAACNIAKGSVLCEGVNFQSTLTIGENSGAIGDCRVYLKNCDLTDATNVWFYSGTHTLGSDTEYTGGGTETNVRLYGGIVTLRQADGSNSHRPFEVYQGGQLLSTGDGVFNVTAIDVFSGGMLDLRKTNILQQIDAVNLHAGASLYDPQGLAGDGTNNAYQFKGCSPAQLAALQLPSNLKYTTAVIT